MEKASINQQELQAIKNLMLLSNTHKNVSVENQLLALKEVNTRQNLEIRGLKCKISSMEKSFRLMEEKLYKVENELNKDPKPTAKRTGSDMSPPRKAQKPRLDAASADPVNTTHTTQSLISSALETLQKSCSDVLPTDRIHALLTGTSELPVLRDEEKHVISEFCVNESLAETFLSVILKKIKVERGFMGHDLLQSLCRVYVGVCQQRGDSHKAHALAYRLLKEGDLLCMAHCRSFHRFWIGLSFFTEDRSFCPAEEKQLQSIVLPPPYHHVDFLKAPKVIMGMVTAWPSFLSHESSLCRAIHIVSNLKAKGKIFHLLTKYLHWDEPPGNIYNAITSTLKSFLEDSSLRFLENSWYGYDLCPATWNYIFSLDLLCAQLGWTWTITNIIRKDLWLILNTWLRQARTEQTPFRDVCVAAVFRLLGRLGQLGLKENLLMSFENLAKSINQFGMQNFSKGMPWEVQLSVIYATHDLAPSNPEAALKTLESWRKNSTQPVPPAVIKCITQISFLCHQTKSQNSKKLL
ncbi:little elongation complex subunit 1-like isoform X3 [Silurus meridionalis]|uniref:little elongation complex subunit 1-like isoform X3 n=1 Tax=Silurus meridionalis TaxID=175797 RepID=UPI001EEC21D8|nr:little elongation complex subunit 1-like isoform X3 [Silurus meridionalis]